MIKWLKDAVFYEIYPQSFKDSNGDGIGDFQGIIDSLDYIKGLGCNALWINPCFDSPFKDAGYDVRDYYKAAERYGTNEDLYRLFETAHEKGIHVLLDLVPGHTSEEHEWFKRSGKAEPNEMSGRYIWTDFWIRGMQGHPYIGGECERNGTYMLNFFKCQPALNYGFLDPKENWQKGMEDPDCLATREAMKDVILFWLGHGCDGFRVDMAASLVKDDDDNKSGTCAVWRDIFKDVREKYPEAAFVAEWSDPPRAIAGAGFDMDFFLDHPGNGYNSLMRDYERGEADHSYFKAGAGGDINRFLSQYQDWYEKTKGKGYISLLTCNHDTPCTTYTLTDRERMLAFAFLFTMPGVPFLYYGDEIGMRYLADLPTKEGGYTRTGTRTPMQWDGSRNLGFSDTEDPGRLYLPVDETENAPTVQAQEEDPASLLNTVRRILQVRHQYEDLQADAEFDVLYAEGSDMLVYRRGSLLLAVNPSAREAVYRAGSEVGEKNGGTGSVEEPAKKAVFAIGEAKAEGGSLILGPQSFAIFA